MERMVERTYEGTRRRNAKEGMGNTFGRGGGAGRERTWTARYNVLENDRENLGHGEHVGNSPGARAGPHGVVYRGSRGPVSSFETLEDFFEETIYFSDT